MVFIGKSCSSQQSIVRTEGVEFKINVCVDGGLSDTISGSCAECRLISERGILAQHTCAELAWEQNHAICAAFYVVHMQVQKKKDPSKYIYRHTMESSYKFKPA